VDGAIAAVEEALAETVASLSGGPTGDSALALEKLAAGNPLVEEFFCLQNSGHLSFPASKWLYVAEGQREADSSPSPVPSHSAEIQAAQQLEFREKDYARALAAYRRCLQPASDPLLRGIILNAIARVQKKSGLLKDAVSTYKNIVRDCGRVIIPGGLPLVPSASLEICLLSRELGNSPDSLQTSLGLYRSLLHQEWKLERAEFDFFAERAKTLVQEALSSLPGSLDLAAFRGEFQRLKAEEAEQRKKTERMIAFEKAAPLVLEAKIRGRTDQPNVPFTRLAFDFGSDSYLVSMTGPTAPAGGASDLAWGMIIDAERLKENALLPALREHFPSGETTWAVKEKGGLALLSSENPPSGPVTLRMNFAKIPDWTLEFHLSPPRLLRTFLLSRRGLYSMVFLLIAGILVFGLALTIRAVSHELELARLKSDFVSTVSHEFKSPLTSIRQLAEMLQSGRVPSQERRQQYYDVLLEQSERLSLLTDNILSLARIEEGRAEFTFESTDLTALLSGVVSSFQERVRHEGFGVELKVAGSIPSVAVDRAALSQAVANLIDNAFKYSGGSKKIEVTASAEGPSLAIAVKDFGIGIKKEDIPKLFERFYRGGDQLTRTVKGSGLGLTLVKEIVQAHRGTVRVESEPGKGSVFSILLPLLQREGR
jgi:signal transduction histidine kinase